jgi:hypothetical protein
MVFKGIEMPPKFLAASSRVIRASSVRPDMALVDAVND